MDRLAPSQAAQPEHPQGVGQGAALTLAGTAVAGLLLLFNEWFAARWLGLPAYGLFALALALAKIGDKLAVLGLHVTALRFVPPARLRGDHGALVRLVRDCVWPSALAGALLALAGASLAVPLATDLFGKPALAPLIGPVMLAVPFFALTEVLGNVARGLGNLGHYVIARHLAPQLVLLALLLLGHGLERTTGIPLAVPAWAAWSFAASGLVAAALAAWLVRRTLAGMPRRAAPAVAEAADDVPRRMLWRSAWPVWVNGLLYLVIGWADLLLLGWLAPVEAAGLYRACAQAVIVFDMLSVAFNAASAHAFALAACAVGAAAVARGLVVPLTQALRGLVLLATPVLAVLLLQADAVLSLLGPAFVPAAGTLRVLALGQFLNCWFSIVAFALVMSGRQGLEMRNAAAAAVVNLALNAALIPHWGTLGAALASAATLLMLNLLRLRQLHAHHGILACRTPELRLLLSGLAVAGLGQLLWHGLGGPTGNFTASEALLSILMTAACTGAGLVWPGLQAGQRSAWISGLWRRGGARDLPPEPGAPAPAPDPSAALTRSPR